MNNSPSDIFSILLLFKRYHQSCQVVLAATSRLNVLTLMLLVANLANSK